MKTLPNKQSDPFVAWGRQGGKKRASRLSRIERATIAAIAARARWGKKMAPLDNLRSVRLDLPQLGDPVYLEELLVEGSLQDWKLLYHKIADYPFGETSQSLAKVLSSAKIYGITTLWQGILNSIQGNWHEK